MLHYPKMRGAASSPPNAKCIAFEKLDGTNLHFDWSRELGWVSFGCRRDDFPFSFQGSEDFAKAHANLKSVFLKFVSLAAPIQDVFFKLGTQNGKVFTEFLGDESFAGSHKDNDETARLVIIDAEHDGVMIPPDEFVVSFGHLPIPNVVYRGKFNGKFTDLVRKGQFDVKEGIVAKGVHEGKIWLAKVKTDAYMQKLKETFNDDWHKYWE